MSEFVQIRSDWHGAGRIGLGLGPARRIVPYKGSSGQFWTPVLWDDREDPDWHKSAGLVSIIPGKRVQKRLRERGGLTDGQV